MEKSGWSRARSYTGCLAVCCVPATEHLSTVDDGVLALIAREMVQRHRAEMGGCAVAVRRVISKHHGELVA